jgi:hypothetical protein
LIRFTVSSTQGIGGIGVREFIILIGEIFFIALLQTIIETFLEQEKRPRQMGIINIACIMGSLYLLLKFVYDNILSEISSFVQFPF